MQPSQACDQQLAAGYLSPIAAVVSDDDTATASFLNFSFPIIANLLTVS